MTDNEGKTHQGTNWVCRYDQGNSPQDPATLRQNVMPVGCKPEACEETGFGIAEVAAAEAAP
jgi:hypothetical protein